MAGTSPDCVFCKIVEGIFPARVVYRDPFVVAFEDANPVAPIHVLIVPREHIATFNDIGPDDLTMAHITRAAQAVARDLGVADEGYRIVVNVNKGGGQVVFHLHAHLMAGKHLGNYLLVAAVAVSTVWRKVVKLFRRDGQRGG
jgi:histidine triad (HIT) family protein